MWKDFLTTKFAFWIDTCLSIDYTLHDSGRAVEKSGILLQIEKAPETSGDLTYYVFSLEDVVAHLSVTDPNGILKIVIEGRIGKFYGVMYFYCPLGVIKFFIVVSLFDPSFVDCIVLDKDTTHYSTSKFHDIHSIQGRTPLVVLHLPPLVRRIFRSWWLL